VPADLVGIFGSYLLVQKASRKSVKIQRIRVNAIYSGVIDTPPILQWFEWHENRKQSMLAHEPIGRVGAARSSRALNGYCRNQPRTRATRAFFQMGSLKPYH
jgi:NAD(P)-dependent dehydrogenase (short-subunit alcohol dehydrogenase family)